MEENEVKVDASLDAQNTAEDYLSVIRDLKSNSVSKNDYDKLREENRQLLNSIVNNSYQAKEEEPEVQVYRDPEVIANELYDESKGMTNFEIANLSSELYDSLVSKGRENDIVPHKPNEKPSEEALASVRRTIDVFKQCIEEANGNPALFNAYLQNRLVDVRKGSR